MLFWSLLSRTQRSMIRLMLKMRKLVMPLTILLLLIVSSCSFPSSESSRDESQLSALPVIDFRETSQVNFNATSPGSFKDGWSASEGWASWSHSPTAIMRFALPDGYAGTVSCDFLTAQGKGEDLNIVVSNNGTEILNMSSRAGSQNKFSIQITEDLVKSQGVFEFKLDFSPVYQPSVIGGSADKRFLGINVNACNID